MWYKSMHKRGAMSCLSKFYLSSFCLVAASAKNIIISLNSDTSLNVWPAVHL